MSREGSERAATGPSALVPPLSPADEAAKVAELRAGMPAVTAGIYLNAGSNGPLPREVDLAVRQIQDQELATGRGSEHIMEDGAARIDELRGVFAGVLATDLELVAVSHSTTEAVIRPALGMDWRAGDRIVTLDEEYPAIRGSLAAIARRAGATLATVSTRDAAGRPLGDDALEAAVAALLTAPTRLLVISRISWMSGRILPVAPLLERARANGILTILDGAQSVGAHLEDVDALDPDVYAFPSQKWLLGIEGLAGMRLSRRALSPEGFAPVIGGFLAFERQPLDGSGAFHADARRFEMSGFSRPSLVGAARAAGWLQMQVGLPWAVARAKRLAAAFHAGARSIAGVEMLAAPGGHGTIVALRIAGWEPEAVVAELGRRAFAVTRRVPGLPAVDGRSASAPALRTSWGFWNTDEEVARILGLVELMASHTPESLPRPPAIDIVHG